MLEIKNLRITLKSSEKPKTIVEGASLSIPEQKIVALVGGSGSGKTSLGLSLLRLLSPVLTIEKGEIIFLGENILFLPQSKMRHIRGKQISMVFQEPLNAFNPVFTIGYQIEEVLRYHTDLNPQKRKERVQELLQRVEIPEPLRVSLAYPHQLSGGMRQRAMIAMAIALSPRLIIADEPTSNLDVTLQAKIMELFQKLKKDLKVSILLITHDLGVVGHLADEVAVMSEGKIIESGLTQEITQNPRMDYTRRLMEAVKI